MPKRISRGERDRLRWLELRREQIAVWAELRAHFEVSETQSFEEVDASGPAHQMRDHFEFVASLDPAALADRASPDAVLARRKATGPGAADMGAPASDEEV